MACFANINVSQGSVATCAMCGGIFNIHLTTNLPKNLPVKNFYYIGSDLTELWPWVCDPNFWPALYVKVKVKNQTVQKLQTKQTDRRTDTTDFIIFFANVVGN